MVFFKVNHNKLFGWLITVEVTQIQHYTPKTKQQSKQRVSSDELKMTMVDLSVKKVMTIFLHAV